MLCLFANMFKNQKRSVIFARVLTIEISKINRYVNRHNWIDTIKRFQLYKYENYYIDLT